VPKIRHGLLLRHKTCVQACVFHESCANPEILWKNMRKCFAFLGRM